MGESRWGQRIIRGAISGLAGGAASALILWVAVEPSITDAIALEEANGGGHSHDSAVPAESDDGELISRTTQLVGGTVTAVVVGVLFGIAFAVVYARTRHRLVGQTDLGRSVGLGALAFLALGLLPALKVPANPPGVGDPGTVNDRTLSYLATILVGILLILVCLAVSRAAQRRTGRAEKGWAAGVGMALLGAAAILIFLPTVSEEIPATVPASLVWEFRMGSLGQHAGMWLGIGLAYGALSHRRSMEGQPTVAPNATGSTG